jgi:hypothetical protein
MGRSVAVVTRRGELERPPDILRCSTDASAEQVSGRPGPGSDLSYSF